MNDQKHQILVFQEGSVRIEVDISPSEDTVWLSQEQIASLFEVDRTSVLRHINHIYQSEELDPQSTCAEIAHMGSKNVQPYKKKQYNLEMITSVGYRVNSKRGISFRRWANRILKDYLIKGYCLDRERLASDVGHYRQFSETVRLLAGMACRKEMAPDESKSLLEVIGRYAYALDTLDQYDRRSMTISHITTDEPQVKLVYEDAVREIRKMPFFATSTLFGREKDHSFQGAVNAIYQSADGEEVYPSVEEKAAHLLYFIVKDHAFYDGNKRIAASLFLWFLDMNAVLVKPDGRKIIEDNALVAIVMMIALSDPSEKEAVVKIIIRLINRCN